VEANFINATVAACTTANARIKLYNMTDFLNPDQPVYVDTDSMKYLYDPDNLNHKSYNTPIKDLPAGLRFGEALGQWSNELDEGDYIAEIVCLGAKRYACRTIKGDYDVKMKGVSLNASNAEIFNFNRMKQTVLNNEAAKSAPMTQFLTDKATGNVITKELTRTVSSTIKSKRVLLDDHSTLPKTMDGRTI
jgi:hypothetical protein